MQARKKQIKKTRGNAMLWAIVFLFGAAVGIFKLMQVLPIEQWIIGAVFLLLIPFGLRTHLNRKKGGIKVKDYDALNSTYGASEKQAKQAKQAKGAATKKYPKPIETKVTIVVDNLVDKPIDNAVEVPVSTLVQTPYQELDKEGKEEKKEEEEKEEEFNIIVPRIMVKTHGLVESKKPDQQEDKGDKEDKESEDHEEIKALEEIGSEIEREVEFLTRWVMPQQKITVQGQTISGGLFYMGSWAAEVSQDSEPSMIDTSLPVSFKGPHEPLSKGSTYLTMLPSQRGAYLNWLAGGRQDPQIDLSYVCLFFHGMERRLVTDVVKSKAGPDMLKPMIDEFKKILNIYGSIDRVDAVDLRSAILSLTNLLTALDGSRKLYDENFSSFKANDGQVQILTQIAVAKAALEDKALSASLALSWLQNNPLVRLPTAALICKRCFDPIFMEMYQKIYPSGLVVSKKSWGLQIKYTPSSPSLKSRGTCVFTFDKLPNIALDIEASKKIQSVANEAEKPLLSFCKEVEACGGNVTVRARLSLPSRFYPDSLLSSLHDLHKRVSKNAQAFDTKDLAAVVGLEDTDFPNVAIPLARALVEQGVGMEPDVLNGAKGPGPRDKMVLFALLDEFGLVQEFGGAQAGAEGQATAQLALQLACLVASADGDLGIHEMGYLKEIILSWTHLPENVRRRLLAHMRLLRASPISLSLVKPKTDELDTAQKKFCADLVRSVAALDQNIAASRMKSKVFERVIEALS